MKITFLGNFVVPYTTETHHANTYEKLGHTVTRLQEGRVTADIILREARNSDMFVWTHTHGWNTAGIDTVLAELKRLNIPTVGYHLDLWLGINREKDLFSSPYWKLQYFFCTDKLMVDWLNEREGYPKAFFLPAGVYEDECYLGEVKPELQYDVIFVGSRNYHPEWPYRPKLVKWLEDTYGSRFAHFGHDGKGVMRGADLNNLYRSAKVVVGDTLCKNFEYPYYYSDRVFETTGRGGFLIMPYIVGLEDHFSIGSEIITYPFNDFTILKSTIDYFIANDAEREAIRERGHERTKQDHTYTQRLAELITTIQNEIKSNNN